MNPPPAVPTLTPPNPVFPVVAVVPLAVVTKSSVPFGVCPHPVFTMKTTNSAIALNFEKNLEKKESKNEVRERAEN